jgi:APA family basic amino acid/polyamine antiporter
MLSYVVTISISAFTIPPYLGYFWAPLKESPIVGTSAAIVIILFLMTMNIIGIRETSVINIVAAIMDIATQVSLVIIGFILLFNPSVLFQHIIGYWPTAGNLVMGIALASIAYTGIETTSQMAEETRKPEKNVPRALGLMIVAVLTIFAGISIVSLLAVSPEQLASEWARDPVAGIAANIPVAIIASIFKPLIGILAGTILLIATNAGLIGISRLAFSLGQYNLMPSVLSRVHPKFKTPYFSIIIFTVIAIAILIPGFFASNVFGGIGALYAFGSLLAFMFSHAAIISLRVRKPELPRPFKLGGNIRIKGRELPITALLGLLSTFIVWIIISIMQPFSSWVGFIWVAAGLVIYCLYRQKRRMPLLSVSKSVAK